MWKRHGADGGNRVGRSSCGGSGCLQGSDCCGVSWDIVLFLYLSFSLDDFFSFRERPATCCPPCYCSI